jgi:dihydropteroate synthase
MGVINLSPESFYKGSIAETRDEVIELVMNMEEAGADLIDIGGASSAPTKIYGTSHVKHDDELRRVSSIMEEICRSTELPISIDTTSAAIAEVALNLGASIVNDISGLKNDPGMAKLAAEREVPVVAMAHCGESCVSLDSTLRALRSSLQIAESAGIPRHRIIVDPGFGFGKPEYIDLEILRNLNTFSSFGHPVLVGISRKAFIGAILGQPDPESRLAGTIAATTVAVAGGADVIRAHDIREARVASEVGSAVRTSGGQ